MKNARSFIYSYAIALTGTLSILFYGCEKEKNDDIPGNIYNGKTKAVFNPSVTYGTMTDQEGNTYNTVTIGTQTWMAENLRTTKYRDGSEIHLVKDNTEWNNTINGAFCNYDNSEDIDTIATYGRLYNWYAVDDARNIAPEGWHMPTDAEWTTLTTYLGGEPEAGGKLKETGYTHWESPNTEASNETGYTAIPGGTRYSDGRFTRIGISACYWSATEGNPDYVFIRCMDYNICDVGRYVASKERGYSIRCVMD